VSNIGTTFYLIAHYVAYSVIALALAALTLAILRTYLIRHYWENPALRIFGALRSARTSGVVLIVLFVVYFVAYAVLLTHFAPLSSRADNFSGRVEISIPADSIVRAIHELSETQATIKDAIKQQSDNIKAIGDAVRAQKIEGRGPVLVTPGNDSANTSGGSGWGPYVWIVCLLLLIPLALWTIGYSIESPRMSSSAKYFLRASTSSLALVSISIGTIITVKELTIFRISISPQLAGKGVDSLDKGIDHVQKVTINFPEVSDNGTQFDCGSPVAPELNPERNDMRIGPFPTGWADPEGADPNIKKEFDVTFNSLKFVVEHIKLQTVRADLIGLMLVGSFDQLRLKPRLQQKYGENAGLAMARAIWVKNQFSDVYGLLLGTKIMTVTAGPGHAEISGNAQTVVIDNNALPIAGDLDRAVQVCAIWRNKR
jgi:hypothetical protein